jgi:hypothetical protein
MEMLVQQVCTQQQREWFLFALNVAVASVVQQLDKLAMYLHKCDSNMFRYVR